jgi:hypothetical protein
LTAWTSHEQLLDMKNLARVVVAVLLVTMVGCGKDAKWMRSRDVYCTEVHFAKSATLLHLSEAQRSLKGAADPSRRECVCTVATGKIEKAGAFLLGFEKSTFILAMGRDQDDSIEKAGFVMNKPFEPIFLGNERAVEQECRKGDVQKATATLGQKQAEVVKYLDEKLALCSKHGWKFTQPPR